jgi:hypothetical protein
VTCTAVAMERPQSHLRGDVTLTIEEVMHAGVYCRSAPRLYNEDLTQLELELGRVLEMTVQGD